jgi:hypothetical protein
MKSIATYFLRKREKVDAGTLIMACFEAEIHVERDSDETFTMVTLKLFLQGCVIHMTPELPEHIAKIDVDAERGCFDSKPGNGAFSVAWNPDKITLEVAKSGDGRGGNINVELAATPALLLSLRAALKKWKAAFIAQ